MTTQTHHCPVCRASFRAVATCSRCGADLLPLMRLVAGAWALRQGARSCIRAGDFDRAARLAKAAADAEDTPAARQLLLLAKWAANRAR